MLCSTLSTRLKVFTFYLYKTIFQYFNVREKLNRNTSKWLYFYNNFFLTKKNCKTRRNRDVKRKLGFAAMQ